MNQLDFINLKHNVDMLRIQFDTLDTASKRASSSDHEEGLRTGIKLANNAFLEYIERLEKLVKEGK